MGETPKKKKKKKNKDRDLEHRLRRLGLRKGLAKRIADNATNVRGQLPSSARDAIKEMRAKVEDLGAGAPKPPVGDPADGAPEAGGEAAKKQSDEARTKKLAKKLRKAGKKSVKKAKKARKAAKAKAKQAHRTTSK